mmetsp:Transcript_31332/g.93572  ORF Transcript_31332/g.93572 Transcript_31332/m.93572 type:complete len:287 (+) Transcript_31332:892-1752(+)
MRPQPLVATDRPMDGLMYPPSMLSTQEKYLNVTTLVDRNAWLVQPGRHVQAPRACLAHKQVLYASAAYACAAALTLTAPFISLALMPDLFTASLASLLDVKYVSCRRFCLLGNRCCLPELPPPSPPKKRRFQRHLHELLLHALPQQLRQLRKHASAACGWVARQRVLQPCVHLRIAPPVANTLRKLLHLFAVGLMAHLRCRRASAQLDRLHWQWRHRHRPRRGHGTARVHAHTVVQHCCAARGAGAAAAAAVICAPEEQRRHQHVHFVGSSHPATRVRRGVWGVKR